MTFFPFFILLLAADFCIVFYFLFFKLEGSHSRQRWWRGLKRTSFLSSKSNLWNLGEIYFRFCSLSCLAYKCFMILLLEVLQFFLYLCFFCRYRILTFCGSLRAVRTHRYLWLHGLSGGVFFQWSIGIFDKLLNSIWQCRGVLFHAWFGLLSQISWWGFQ